MLISYLYSFLRLAFRREANDPLVGSSSSTLAGTGVGVGGADSVEADDSAFGAGAASRMGMMGGAAILGAGGGVGAVGRMGAAGTS